MSSYGTQASPIYQLFCFTAILGLGADIQLNLHAACTSLYNGCFFSMAYNFTDNPSTKINKDTYPTIGTSQRGVCLVWRYTIYGSVARGVHIQLLRSLGYVRSHHHRARTRERALYIYVYEEGGCAKVKALGALPSCTFGVTWRGSRSPIPTVTLRRVYIV